MMPEINPVVVCLIIAVFGLIWMKPPQKVFWKTDFWRKHVCADFSESGHHPACAMCNVTDNDVCYKNPDKCAAMRHPEEK